MIAEKERNPLYPIFIKLHQISTVIIGAGEVGFEKLSFMLKSSPDGQLTLIAPEISPKINALLRQKKGHKVTIIKKPFAPIDLDGHNLVVAATNIKSLNAEVHREAKLKGKLINVADTPELCDFYLGSIVTRGNLKVAISTNGKSPTFAKRFRQLLEEILPEETNELLSNLKIVRDRLKGNFEEKVKRLNKITASLVEREN